MSCCKRSLVLAEVFREHGQAQAAVDQSIVELKLGGVFQFETGEHFEGM